jgi:hypothetical protein
MPKTVTYLTLKNYKIAGDLKFKYLDVEATRVEVAIEVDEALDELIKAGKESLKISHLGDVAKAEIDKVAGLFTDTMEAIERKIEKDKLDGDATARQVKEASEVLKHYAKIVEANATAAVEKEWQAYLARRAHLKGFRIKCVVKLVLGSIGVGVAVGSAVLSFGTLWMNIAVAVKGVTDLIQTAKTWAKDIDGVYADLLKDIATVDDLNREREIAYKKNNGQKLSKTKEGLKELTNALFPITKSMLKATSEVENTCKQFLGLVAKLENQADDIVGEINKAIKLMSKLPEKEMPADLKKIAKEMEKSFEKLFGEIEDLHRKSQNAAKFGERCHNAAKKLRKEDSWVGLDPEGSLDLGKNAIAAYAVANFIYQCCMEGKALIPL